MLDHREEKMRREQVKRDSVLDVEMQIHSEGNSVTYDAGKLDVV